MGAWMLIVEAIRGSAPSAPWGSLHAHLLLVGFLLLLIIGVAFWTFPRIRGRRPGREWGWVAFALINAGLLLRLFAQPLATGPDPPSAWRAVLVGEAAPLQQSP